MKLLLFMFVFGAFFEWKMNPIPVENSTAPAIFFDYIEEASICHFCLPYCGTTPLLPSFVEKGDFPGEFIPELSTCEPTENLDGVDYKTKLSEITSTYHTFKKKSTAYENNGYDSNKTTSILNEGHFETPSKDSNCYSFDDNIHFTIAPFKDVGICPIINYTKEEICPLHEMMLHHKIPLTSLYASNISKSELDIITCLTLFAPVENDILLSTTLKMTSYNDIGFCSLINDTKDFRPLNEMFHKNHFISLSNTNRTKSELGIIPNVSLFGDNKEIFLSTTLQNIHFATLEDLGICPLINDYEEICLLHELFHYTNPLSSSKPLEDEEFYHLNKNNDSIVSALLPKSQQKNLMPSMFAANKTKVKENSFVTISKSLKDVLVRPLDNDDNAAMLVFCQNNYPIMPDLKQDEEQEMRINWVQGSLNVIFGWSLVLICFKLWKEKTATMNDMKFQRIIREKESIIEEERALNKNHVLEKEKTKQDILQLTKENSALLSLKKELKETSKRELDYLKRNKIIIREKERRDQDFELLKEQNSTLLSINKELNKALERKKEKDDELNKSEKHSKELKEMNVENLKKCMQLIPIQNKERDAFYQAIDYKVDALVKLNKLEEHWKEEKGMMVNYLKECEQMIKDLKEKKAELEKQIIYKNEEVVSAFEIVKRLNDDHKGSKKVILELREEKDLLLQECKYLEIQLATKLMKTQSTVDKEKPVHVEKSEISATLTVKEATPKGKTQTAKDQDVKKMVVPFSEKEETSRSTPKKEKNKSTLEKGKLAYIERPSFIFPLSEETFLSNPVPKFPLYLPGVFNTFQIRR